MIKVLFICHGNMLTWVEDPAFIKCFRDLKAFLPTIYQSYMGSEKNFSWKRECIAIVNKVPNSNYEYIVVEGVDYDNVYYKTFFSNKDFMKKSDFIKYVSDLYIAEKRRDLWKIEWLIY